MKFLRKPAVENKKLVLYLVALTALGVFALSLGRFMPTPADVVTDFAAEKPQVITYPACHAAAAFELERALEVRLEEFFSMVEGAGRVRVMISPLAGRETVFAVDVNKNDSYSKEQDAQGGTRETRQHQSQEKTVMITDRQGTDRPLILREIEPQVKGVVILAEGGDSPFVRDALTRAARAVLGLETHNIQVLTGSF